MEFTDEVPMVEQILPDIYKIEIPLPKSPLKALNAYLIKGPGRFLLVDTGAMSVTLPMSLVEALGLSDRLGDEISVAVAGGGRVRGRKLTIPQLSVQGHELENVRAIVLDEFDAGVDGLLGLSYLKRFAIRIDSQHPDKLAIEPRPSEGNPP